MKSTKIRGFDYIIYESGKIFSLRSKKFMTPVIRPDGYMGAHLWKDGRYHTKLIHRLLLQAFVPKPHNGRLVCNHKNFNKKDNRLSNLEWVTQKQNIRHALKHNRNGFHFAYKFEKEVIEQFPFVCTSELMEKYNCSHSTIMHIVKKKYSKQYIKTRRYLFTKNRKYNRVDYVKP